MEYHLQLTGFVGGRDFDKAWVDYKLNELKGQPVNVLIDSLGGSLATALSIASAFHNHGNVTVHFVGMNASAATIASLGAKHVSMDASAMYLAHKCSTSFFEWGSMNADQLQNIQDEIEQMKTDLDKMDANVARMYAARTGKTIKELLDLMKVGGWLSAQEALGWGFVDEITAWDDDKSTAEITDTIASVMQKQGLPLPCAIHEDSLVKKIVGAISNIFKTPEASFQKTLKPYTAMKKTFTNLCALLALDAFEFNEQKETTVTDEQLQKFEDALSENKTAISDRDAKITSLETEIEALKKRPADTTSHVINNGGEPSDPESQEVKDFYDTFQSSKSLFDSLP